MLCVMLRTPKWYGRSRFGLEEFRDFKVLILRGNQVEQRMRNPH